MACSRVASSPLLRRAVSETRLATWRRHGSKVVGLSGSSKWPSQSTGCRQNLHHGKYDDAAENQSDNATLSVLLQELCSSVENVGGPQTPSSKHREPGSPLQFGKLRADFAYPIQRHSSATSLPLLDRKKAISSNSFGRSSGHNAKGVKASTLPNLAYPSSHKASDVILDSRLLSALQAPVPRHGKPKTKVSGDVDVQEKTGDLGASRAHAHTQDIEKTPYEFYKCLERGECKEATFGNKQRRCKESGHQVDLHRESPKQNFTCDQTLALNVTAPDQLVLEGLLQTGALRVSRDRQIAECAEGDCQRAVSREQMPTVQLLSSELLSDRVPSRGCEREEAWQVDRVPSRSTKRSTNGNKFFVDLSTHIEEYDEGALDTGLFFSRLGTGTVKAGSDGFVVVNRSVM